MMLINFVSEEIDFKIDNEEAINNWIVSVIASEKPEHEIGEISLVFTSDEYLLNVNKNFLNHDYYTDIITFDNNNKNVIAGDLLISVDRVAENAPAYDTTFENELHRIIIHGILHLLGYKDKTEEEETIMTQKEDQYLALL